jgi:hypothetical protein
MHGQPIIKITQRRLFTENTDVAHDVREENFPARSNVYEICVRTFI